MSEATDRPDRAKTVDFEAENHFDNNRLKRVYLICTLQLTRKTCEDKDLSAIDRQAQEQQAQKWADCATTHLPAMNIKKECP